MNQTANGIGPTSGPLAPTFNPFMAAFAQSSQVGIRPSVSENNTNLASQVSSPKLSPISGQSSPKSAKSLQMPTLVSSLTRRSSPMTQRPSSDGEAKRNRSGFLSEQLLELEKAFTRTPYPNQREREVLARKTDLPEARVQVR